MLVEIRDETSAIFTPYGMYLTSSFIPVDFLELEFRPGYIIGGDYWGYELGAFLKINLLPTKIFVIGGVNNHLNTIESASNSGGAFKKYMLFNGIGIGYQKDSKLSIDIMYHWTSNKDFGYSNIHDKLGYLFTYKKNMSGIIKVGVSLAWEVLKM
jgi:hypothetical protein